MTHAGSEQESTAVARVWGHGRVPVHLEIERYPTWAWILRVTLRVIGWIVITALTLIITFDPFIASFPFVIGIGLIYSSIRGRYLVRSFNGNCPACAKALALAPGSKINLPHELTCFGCHFAPELILTEAEAS
jgi:hypothetical protein